LGIGLNLVKRLTAKHGGTVEAMSAGPDQGSTFTIRLPVEEQKMERTSNGGQHDSDKTEKTEPLRILIVDDNHDAADLLQQLLEMMGHAVKIAHDGREAVRMAGEFRPDLGLFDIGMPGMNGYELARAIREIPELRKTVLVAVTGWGAKEDRERSREAGFDHHLTKPIDFEMLNELITKVGPSHGQGESP
jgi:CheY-like chemotaxis protein